MTEMEKLHERVEAAKDNLDEREAAHRREVEDLTRSLSHAQDMVEALEARNQNLADDNRQLREMLQSLLETVAPGQAEGEQPKLPPAIEKMLFSEGSDEDEAGTVH